MSTKILFLCGMPNSGKSTISFALLNSGFAKYVVTPGHWLRHLMTQKTSDLAQYMSNNWSNDVLEPIVREHVDEQLEDFVRRRQGQGHGQNNTTTSEESSNIIVVEGYPRTECEAQHCVQWAQRYPTAIASLEITLEEAQRRARKRNRRGDDNTDSLRTRCNYWLEHVDDVLGACEAPQMIFRLQDATVDSVKQNVKFVLLDERPPPPITQDNTPPSTFLEQVSAKEHGTIVQMQLRLAGTPRRKRQFCGAHPVSLDRQYLPRLRRYPYLCSLKIDGQRLFCVVHARRLYFMSRRLQVWRSIEEFAELQRFEGSLLDGEVALNNLFVVLDVLCVSGENVMRLPIIERIAKSVPLGRLFFNAPFMFRPQEYVDRTQLPLLIERGVFGGRLEADGVIFQPAKLPYRLGIDYNLFKWKPFEHNTVDLLWGEDGELYCRKTTSNEAEDDDTVHTLDTQSGVMLAKVPEGTMHPDYAANTPWLQAGTVIECGIMSLGGEGTEILWVPRKPRWDKPFPNMDWVVRKIIGSIRDNITQQEIIEYCQEASLPPSAVPSPPKVRINRT